MGKFRVVFYENSEGISDLDAFIESRDIREQAKIYSFVGMLEDKGPHLPRPYADILRDGIHELRIKLSGNQTRILYFFCYQNYIVLSNSFMKTTSEVPDKYINEAIKRRNDFCSRFSKKELDKLYKE